MKYRFFLILALTHVRPINAAELLTNSAQFLNPPKWLSAYLVNQTAAKIERKLEWSTRRTQVRWYDSDEAFLKALNVKSPSKVLAFARRSDQSIHLSPRVDAKNFHLVFGHELAHIIMFQKFSQSIPLWLEEGLANRSAENIDLDYKWLRTQPRRNLTRLGHPIEASTLDEVNFNYRASLAAVFMLEAKCPSLRELLNLSLRSNVESTLSTYCKIPDVNAAFWQWVDEKSKSG